MFQILFMKFVRFPLNIICIFLSLMSYVTGTDITNYQDDVPYDSFIYNTDPIIVNADTKIESGQSSSNFKISKPGKLYVISSDLKISKNMNWGGDTNNLVLGNSWKETSISIIVIKHPEDKPIVIEGNGNTTINLGRATLIDIQSPVIFKNIRLDRASDAPDSGIRSFGTNNVIRFPSHNLCSTSIIMRAPITFQNCTLSTSNGHGYWCDTHNFTPCSPLMTFENTTLNIKHLVICRGVKSSVSPLIRVDTKDVNKLKSIFAEQDGPTGNIAITSSVLFDMNNYNITYMPIGNFNSNNGRVFYITNANPTDRSLNTIKTQCIQFLQKYCSYSSNKSNINFEICISPFAEEVGTEKDITKYQDTVPYDSFLYSNGQNKLSTNTSVSGRGVYVINSNINLTNNVSWGSNANPVIGNSWNDSTVTTILIKHPQNKTITIESPNNSTIFLEKGVILDIQSPVVFKNVRIYRSLSASNTVINNQSNRQPSRTSAGSNIWSGCFMARAPIKFQDCTLSTSGGTGCWSDIHCLSPHAPLIEFENNRYETKQIYIYRNMKLSTIPLLRISTKEISKFNSFIKTDGIKNNVSISSSMLEDINDENVSYFSVGKFNQNNGKILYITNSVSTPTKDENDIWRVKVADKIGDDDLGNVKQQCIQFLQKYCGLSNNNTDIDIETHISPFNSNISTTQLLSKTGYIDVDMEESEETKFPTDDWLQTIKAWILPLPENNTNISDINIGIIGSAPLKIQARGKTNTVRLNGDWSQYTGTLTIPSNITKICFSNQEIPFNIVANHNLEVGITQPTTATQQSTVERTLPGLFGTLVSTTQQSTNANSDLTSGTLKFSGNLSECTGTISFDKSVSKIILSTDNPTFAIGGDSNLVIGISDSGSDAITLKSSILSRKGTITLDESVKTVTLK